MKVLALDTSTEACSAALYDGGYNQGEVLSRFEIAPRQHTKLILPMIDSLLAEAGWSLRDIELLGYGCGPGAFTGVRLGVSVAQGIAFGAEIPVAGVSSLAALAQAAYSENGQARCLAAIDARMAEVYWARYEVNMAGYMMLQGDESVLPPAQVELPDEGQWSCIGSGFDQYRQELMINTDQRQLTMIPDRFPEARYVASLAAYYAEQGQAVAADQALPVYIRNNVVSIQK